MRFACKVVVRAMCTDEQPNFRGHHDGWEDRLTREQYRIIRCVLEQYVKCIISDGEAYLQLTNNGLTPKEADDILDTFSHV